MFNGKTACFFSHEARAQLQNEQYSLQDIRILRELGFEVTIATTFSEIPWDCDLYFSWWAAGSILPLFKAKLGRKPIIVVAGGNDSMFYRDSISGVPKGYLASPWYKKASARLSLRFATAVIAVSEYMVNDVKRLGAKEPLVVPNSVDTDVFRKGDELRTYVTSIFNLESSVIELKRGEVFIRAIPLVLDEYPEQAFVVIGKKANGYQRLQKIAVDLGVSDHVQFLGTIANSDVISWLQRSLAYVQISDTETFGVAVAEAMSCGAPLVVSRRGAIPELVGDAAVFVDHNDARSVALGIKRVLKSESQELQRMVTAARLRIIQDYSFDKRKHKIQEIIEGL